jgi:hypothetical protein
MRYAGIVLTLGWVLTGSGLAADGPMLPGAETVGENPAVLAGPPTGLDMGYPAAPGCECEAHGLRGRLRQLGAWLTHRPLRTSDRYGCCRARPLIYLPPLYYFWLDRCAPCAGAAYPVVHAPQVQAEGADVR